MTINLGGLQYKQPEVYTVSFSDNNYTVSFSDNNSVTCIPCNENTSKYKDWLAKLEDAINK